MDKRDIGKLLGDAFGLGDPLASATRSTQESLELLTLKAKAAKVDELTLLVAKLKRKAQHLIDVAHNRALDEMLAGAKDGELWARANRLRRKPRHADEFGEKP